MKTCFFIVLMGACGFVPFAAAQIDSAPPSVEAYSKCLREAVDREKTRPNPSLDRVKSACAAEYRVLAQELSPDLLREITALIDEGLRRELQR